MISDISGAHAHSHQERPSVGLTSALPSRVAVTLSPSLGRVSLSTSLTLLSPLSGDLGQQCQQMGRFAMGLTGRHGAHLQSAPH